METDKICNLLENVIVELRGNRHIKKHPGTKHQRLTELKKALCLNQTRFADEIGVSLASLSSAERGKSFLRVETLEFMAEKYGVSLNWLLNGEGEMFLKKNVA